MLAEGRATVVTDRIERFVPDVDMTSGYIRRAQHLFPRSGSRRPWSVGQNHLID